MKMARREVVANALVVRAMNGEDAFGPEDVGAFLCEQLLQPEVHSGPAAPAGHLDAHGRHPIIMQVLRILLLPTPTTPMTSAALISIRATSHRQDQLISLMGAPLYMDHTQVTYVYAYDCHGKLVTCHLPNTCDFVGCAGFDSPSVLIDHESEVGCWGSKLT